jgi:hypothetical protein
MDGNDKYCDTEEEQPSIDLVDIQKIHDEINNFNNVNNLFTIDFTGIKQHYQYGNYYERLIFYVGYKKDKYLKLEKLNLYEEEQYFDDVKSKLISYIPNDNEINKEINKPKLIFRITLELQKYLYNDMISIIFDYYG